MTDKEPIHARWRLEYAAAQKQYDPEAIAWGLHLCNEVAAQSQKLQHLLATLKAIEHAVAIVYGHFSRGHLTRCNTDPQLAIAVIENTLNEHADDLITLAIPNHLLSDALEVLRVGLEEVPYEPDISDEAKLFLTGWYNSQHPKKPIRPKV